jgi:hemoglobin
VENDITTRTDLERLVSLFYEAIKSNDEISFFFTETIMVNWDLHETKMVDFWENALFFEGNYSGNPIDAHHHLHTMEPMSSSHYELWIKLFNQVVFQNFQGENANKIVQHAKAIAQILQDRN